MSSSPAYGRWEMQCDHIWTQAKQNIFLITFISPPLHSRGGPTYRAAESRTKSSVAKSCSGLTLDRAWGDAALCSRDFQVTWQHSLRSMHDLTFLRKGAPRRTQFFCHPCLALCFRCSPSVLPIHFFRLFPLWFLHFINYIEAHLPQDVRDLAELNKYNTVC